MPLFYKPLRAFLRHAFDAYDLCKNDTGFHSATLLLAPQNVNCCIAARTEKDTAMVAIDTTRSPAPHITGRIISSIYETVHVVTSWNNARVTRNALSKLTNRELDDIGLSRGDIDSVVEAVRR